MTISGGEPMSQPLALLELLCCLTADDRSVFPLGVICFTGYDLDVVMGDPDCAALLPYIDLLIAGPYVESLHSDAGIAGSTNKVFHYNPAPGRGYAVIDPSSVEFDRGVEVRLGDGDGDVLEVTGFPPGRLESLRSAGIRRVPLRGQK